MINEQLAYFNRLLLVNSKSINFFLVLGPLLLLFFVKSNVIKSDKEIKVEHCFKSICVKVQRLPRNEKREMGFMNKG